MNWLYEVLQQNYLNIKFLHVISVAMWSFSTAVAYRDYIVPSFKSAERHPNDPERIARRNWVMERFDKGAILEHVAFPIVLLTGAVMFWSGDWSLASWSWFSAKMLIVALIFLPIEIVDYYISHFGGNKEKIRATGNMERYETMMQFHWLFFKVTAVLIVIFIPLTYYLAITKFF